MNVRLKIFALLTALGLGAYADAQSPPSLLRIDTTGAQAGDCVKISALNSSGVTAKDAGAPCGGGGSGNATTVNGASVPASSAVIGTNASSQIVNEPTTGTGNNVLATSPTLVTPNLGTPTVLNLSNATNLPASALPSALPNGITATTQAVTDTSAAVATDAFAVNLFASPPAIGSTTPAAVNATTVNATNSASAFQIGGSTFVKQGSAGGNASLGIGFGAGSAWTNSSTIFNVAVGYQALNSDTTGAENTAVGVISMPFLTTGTFDTGVGEHTGGYITTENGDTFIGNDACRNCVGGGFNTAVGKSAMITGGFTNSTAVGQSAMLGNATSITIGGTATNGDVITLTVNANNITTQTVTYTVTTAQTPAQIAAGLVTALNANSTIFSASQGAAAINGGGVGLTSTIQLVLSGTCTSTFGYATCVTAGVSGSATETVTIGGGSTGSDLIAVGETALAGYQMTTASNDIGIGKYSLASLTTGSSDIGIGGSFALASLTTGTDAIAMGNLALQSLTTGTSIIAIGSSAGNSNVTGSRNVYVGTSAGRLATSSDVTAIGDRALTAMTTNSNAQNTAVGSGAGQAVTTGQLFTAVGYQALGAMTNASNGTAMGWKAATNATGNNVTAFGESACSNLVGGANNTCIGAGVGSSVMTTASGNVLMGSGNKTVTTVGAGTIGEINIEGAFIGFAVAPTLTSGWGTSPTAPTQASTFAFTFTVGTGTPTTTGVIGLATAPNGWICNLQDQTSAVTARQSGNSTTSATVTWSAAPTAGDTILAQCNAI